MGEMNRVTELDAHGSQDNAAASCKRPAVPVEDTRAHALRQKTEQVAEAAVQVWRLQARHDALASQLDEVKKARSQKSEEIKRLRGRVQQLLEAECDHYGQLLSRVRVQPEDWRNPSALPAASGAT